MYHLTSDYSFINMVIGGGGSDGNDDGGARPAHGEFKRFP